MYFFFSKVSSLKDLNPSLNLQRAPIMYFREAVWQGAMTKKLEFDWHIKVPDVLVDGCEFDKWTEEEGLDTNCLFKVDEYGFFIFWKKEGKVIKFLDLSFEFHEDFICDTERYFISGWRCSGAMSSQ